MPVALHLDRSDDSSHHRHRYSHRRIRTQTVVGTDHDTGTRLSRAHVVVRDDHFTGAHGAAVWTCSCHRHRRQLGNVELFAISPTIATGTNVANRIVERNKEAI